MNGIEELRNVTAAITKSVAGAEMPGHKYLSRKPLPGGGYAYVYHNITGSSASVTLPTAIPPEHEFIRTDQLQGGGQRHVFRNLHDGTTTTSDELPAQIARAKQKKPIDLSDITITVLPYSVTHDGEIIRKFETRRPGHSSHIVRVRVSLDETPQSEWCDCIGYGTHKHCRHVAAVYASGQLGGSVD